MKHAWILFAIAAFLLAACGPAQEPTMSPADVQGTAMAGAQTMVAETQAAIPTATSIPPTEEPTSTTPPTNTVPPLINLTQSTQGVQVGGGTQPAVTQAVIAPPTNTPASVGANDPCMQFKGSWAGETAKMTVVNNTRPKANIILSVGFTSTPMGECGIAWGGSLSASTSFQVPLGLFWASAFVEGDTDTKAFGGGEISRPGNYTLWIENDRITLKAGCAPDC